MLTYENEQEVTMREYLDPIAWGERSCPYWNVIGLACPICSYFDEYGGACRIFVMERDGTIYG